MSKKPDANDSPSSKDKESAQIEPERFVSILPIATKCAWIELAPIRARISGPGWVKKRNVKSVHDWAMKNIEVEPLCKYLLDRFVP